MDFNRDAGNETVSQLQLNIQNLNQQVIQLESFISHLSDSRATGQRERELFNRKAHDAQELSKQTNALLKKLVVMSNSDKNLRGVRERLQNEYIGVLNRLQASQRKAAQTEKAGMVAAEMDAQAARDASDQDVYGNQGRSGQLQMTAQQQGNLAEMKERQSALHQLEQDIGDVNAIFAELANIVHEQGDMVDSIEANVEHAQIYVEQGAQNVQQAVYYNQKARQKKLLLLCFFVILIFIIGLTIYLAK
uniref:t-SNARE coiled-coil homology domain-containing protein n=1 Tax=Caenorhabditis tropicalis TaxID=1561998 RepID=A0A1I7T198_9PELO